MDNVELIVLRNARDWLQNNHRVMLATVVRTWGSSPRPIGSMMAIREDGRAVGSVSGGCIEDDLINRYASIDNIRKFPDVSTATARYGVSAEEAHRFGLPCGGTLELVLEFNPGLDTLDELVTMLENGELVRRIVETSNGRVQIKRTTSLERLQWDGSRLVNTVGPGYRMLLIGAGVLAEYLATMASFNSFSVVVCDPRREHMDTWSVTGVQKTTEMPDDAVISFQPDQRSCVVALSHDPKLDDLAILQAVCSPAFYVGAIGSRRNNQARRDRLKTYFDMTDDMLTRLRGPVGIYIGSKTPAEIAVSIMAEILATKNGIRLPIEMDVAEAKARSERSIDDSSTTFISHFSETRI
jgi:xanthine dehydrogenase accessory factor